MTPRNFDVRFTPESGHRPLLFDHFLDGGEYCEPGIFTANAFARLASEIVFEPMLRSAAPTATG
jgi:hypothetical protein